MGGTTKQVQVVIQPPQWPRAAEGGGSCESGGTPTSCLDIRRADYAWSPQGDAEQNVAPWSLPDLHIETAPATVVFSRPGQLNIFSADHPDALTDFSQTFSSDTWDVGMHAAQETCVASNAAETTVIRGTGSPETQFVSIYKAGLGTLTWQAASGAPWLTISPTLGSGIGAMGVTANPQGLAPGTYSTTLTIVNTGARLASIQAALPEQIAIPVTMVVLPAKERQLYMPLIERHTP